MMPISATGNKGAENGYTLLELLVVLTIAVLVLAAAPAVYQAASPRAALVSVTDQITAQIIDLRNDAMQKGESAGLRISADGASLIFLPEETEKEIPNSVSIRMAETGREEIWFFQNGRSAGGVLELSKSGRKARIIVRPMTGVIEVEAR